MERNGRNQTFQLVARNTGTIPELHFLGNAKSDRLLVHAALSYEKKRLTNKPNENDNIRIAHFYYP